VAVHKGLVHPALLVSVFVIATSGLVYQLISGTLASYVLGDSVAQFSFIIGLYLFAMGIGSYLSKYVEDHLLVRFVEIELGLALVGGLSAPVLFQVYTSYGAFRLVLYTVVVLVGTLVGLEIPLLIRLLKFSLDLKDLVARVLTLDYIGALFGSVLFPAVLLPRLGIHQTSILFGVLNALVALGSSFIFPIDRAVALRLRGMCAMVLTVLALASALLGKAIESSESFYFGAPIVHASQSPYQRVVMTQSSRSTRLFLNGNLQFSSDDEYRYHEVLVHPPVAALGRDPKRVLVLGGGDGLAVRELLAYPSIETITVIDLDAQVTELFRTLPIAVELNRGALSDPRVTIVNDDAFRYLTDSRESFDLAVVDFPDPSNYSVGKLYTVAFYRMLLERLGTHGVAVVQATSPQFARGSFWSIVATMEEAGWSTAPYHTYIPSFGDWGFVLAAPEATSDVLAPPTSLRIASDGLRYLDEDLLEELFHFPKDVSRIDDPVINRLNEQTLVPLYTEEWAAWGR
jgi:spermidine synthase